VWPHTHPNCSIDCGLWQTDSWNGNPRKFFRICKTDWKHLYLVLGWICGVAACWYLGTCSGEQSCT
jgi:hypothetical protein